MYESILGDSLIAFISNSFFLCHLLEGDQLREDVSLGERAEEHWRSAVNVSRFIGARYMGTAEGVFVVYPGVQIDNKTYDPRRRPW